ncbi:murein biosynthesis integral membrane protein MurJ [Nanchangia anserum]|uniref:Virulence factor MviN n=2 Tax=Nanchangia anserum TaxID=2692125 RepID=A0A8I0GEJ6_9ACTO|nr:lipid II flippase MurJ [Nanchangia anserum]MBD3688639.1 hypothetical protein [Nanchangia anserum]
MPKRAVLGPLVGAAGLISVLTLSARVVGFVRWFAQSAWVGTGEFANAYASANQIPNVAYEVAVGGALAGMTIPLIAQPLGRGERARADHIASVLLTWVLIILVPLALIVWAIAPIIGHAMPTPAGANPEAQVELITTFLRIFSAQIPLYGICAVLTGTLQAHEKFLWPALVPLLSSISVIATYALFGWLSGGHHEVMQVTTPQVMVLGWGTTLGVAMLSVPLFLPVARLGVRLRPGLQLPRADVRRALGLGGAGVIGLVAQQIAVLVVLLVARRYGGPGTLPVYQYSQAVYLLPYAVGAVPIATAMFPRLAKTLDDPACFAAWCRHSTGLVASFGFAGGVLLATQARAAEDVFATINPVPGMREGLLAMAPGLAAYALIYHLTRVLYALSASRAVVVGTSTGWIVVGVGSFVAARFSEGAASREVTTMVSLGLAQSVGMILGAGILLFYLARQRPDALSSFGRTCALCLVAAVIVIPLAWGLQHLLVGDSSSLIAALARSLIGIVVTAVICGPGLVRALRAKAL